METEQFEAIAELMKLRKPETREALRLVLCDGKTQDAAAEQTGVLRPNVARAVKSARDVLKLAQVAAAGDTEIPLRMVKNL